MKPNLQTVAFSVAMILIAVAVALSLTACNKAPGNQPSLGGADSHLHHQVGNQGSPAPEAKPLDLAKLTVAIGDSLFSTPDNQHKTIIDAIQNATASIDLVNYHLSDQNVVEALKAAAGNKVKVRVLLDQSILSQNKTAQSIFTDLTGAGVKVVKSSTGFSITHEKSMVIDYGLADKQTAFITTLNLATLSAQTRDYGIQTQDSGIITELESVFVKDFTMNAPKNTNESPNLVQERLVWSPVNSKAKLVQLINSAKTSIDLQVEHFGDIDIANALVAQAKAGIKIRTLSPACVAGADKSNLLPNQKIIDQLTAAKVTAKVGSQDVDAKHPYIHAKMILVDNETFYIGSENFSMNSLSKARELGILTNDQVLAAQVETIFNQDMDSAVDPSTISSDSCEKATGPYADVGDETIDLQNDKISLQPTTQAQGHPAAPRPTATPSK